MTTPKQSSGSSADSSGGKNNSSSYKSNKNRRKNKNNNKTKTKKKFAGAQTDGALKDKVITQDAPNMASQLRDVRNALSITAAELKYALWAGSIQRGIRIDSKGFVDTHPSKSEYTTVDPNDSTKTIEEKELKEALFTEWSVKMKMQQETMMQYEIDGKSLFHILKGQVDATTIGKLEHKSEYNKIQDDEDVIGLLELLKESCSSNQGGTMTDGPTKMIRSLRTLLVTKQNPHGLPNLSTTEYRDILRDNYETARSQCGNHMLGIKQHEYVLKKDGKKYADYVNMPANERKTVDAKVDDMLMARLMIEGSSQENGISLHLKNQYSTGSKSCYPETLSDAVGMIDNYDTGAATKRRPHNSKSDNDRGTDDNIAGAHVSDNPNGDNSYGNVDDDSNYGDDDMSDDDTVDDTVDGTTDDKQNVVEAPTDDPNIAPTSNSMAAILAAVENDPMLDDPNQYESLDDDEISFYNGDIGEVAGMMVAEINESDDESDDDSIPHLVYREGGDDSSDDSSERSSNTDYDDESSGDDEGSVEDIDHADRMKEVLITNLPHVRPSSQPAVFAATGDAHVDDIIITSLKLKRIGKVKTNNITHYVEARRTFSTYVETHFTISTSTQNFGPWKQFRTIGFDEYLWSMDAIEDTAVVTCDIPGAFLEVGDEVGDSQDFCQGRS